MDARAHGPYRICQVYTNGTCDVERAPGVVERMNIRRLVPFFRPQAERRWNESVVENVEAAPAPNVIQQNDSVVEAVETAYVANCGILKKRPRYS